MEGLCGVHSTRLRRPSLPFFSGSPTPLCLKKPSSVSFLSAAPLLAGRAPSRRPHLSIRASRIPRNNPPPSTTPEPSDETIRGALSSLLKPACVALVAGAALLFARLHRSSLAFAVALPPQPAAQSETFPSSSSAEDGPGTLTDQEKERTLEDHLATHPDDTRSLRSLMELKIKTRNLPEAIGLVDHLILLEPGEKDLPLLKAHLQTCDGDTQTAKQGFEEILSKDPLMVEAYHGLVVAATQSESDGDLGVILKRIEVAMELCKKEKRKDELRDFKLLMAQVKVMGGDYDEALQVYQELVKEEPRDFRPYLCQGIIYTLLRKKDEAEKQFQKYRRLVPKEHPYAQYFDQNMATMKVFSQSDENKNSSTLKR